MKTTDEQIKLLEETRDEFLKAASREDSVPNRSGWVERAQAAALTAILADWRESRELLEAATEIAFNGEKFMHKIYKLGGQWSDIRKDEWHNSALEAWAEVKKGDKQ